jgi:hypothetical protein
MQGINNIIPTIANSGEKELTLYPVTPIVNPRSNPQYNTYFESVL